MGRLPLTALKPGMVLAEQVRDRNGRLLLDSGVVLEERHLRIFKIWGVAEVAVTPGAADASQQPSEEEFEIPTEILEASRQYQKARFAHNDSTFTPIVRLENYCVERLARKATQQGLAPGVLAARSMALETTPEKQPAQPHASAELRFDPEKLIREELTMGTLPMIFHKLVDVVNDPTSSALDAAEVIEKDPELAVRLLKIVNSSFYGMRAKVESVSRAVAIIGGNQLLSLAVGLSVVTTFKGIPTEMVDMEAFWRHSVACGIAARLLAGHHNAPNTERFFVGGLLHDIGRLALYAELPDTARKVMERSRAAGRLLVDEEVHDFGFSHCRLGGLLLETWKLPLSLENTVAYHHDPLRAQHKLEASILQVADMLVNALELGGSGERYVPHLEPNAWELLHISPAVLLQVASQMEMQLDDVLRFFTDG